MIRSRILFHLKRPQLERDSKENPFLAVFSHFKTNASSTERKWQRVFSFDKDKGHKKRRRKKISSRFLLSYILTAAAAATAVVHLNETYAERLQR